MKSSIYYPDEVLILELVELLGARRLEIFRPPTFREASAIRKRSTIYDGLDDFEMPVGDRMQFSEALNMCVAYARSLRHLFDTRLTNVFRHMIKLVILLEKAEMNHKLRDVVAGIKSIRNTTVSVKEQVHCLQGLLALLPTSESSELESACNAAILAVVLLSVYQYLIRYMDRGGSITYSSGSLDFRDTYVSIVLFQGAYVWIKFRDVAPKRSVYRRPKKDKASGNVVGYGKYEPKFKPPREKNAVTGKSQQSDHLPLGGYATQQDAEVVCQIAGFYYNKDEGSVKLEDGSYFSIPPMSEQERGLSGKEKRNWVSARAKEVFEYFKKEKAAQSEWCSMLQEIVAGEVDIMPAEDGEFNQGIASQHEQHIQYQQRLQEQILDLQNQLQSSRAYCGKWCSHLGPT